MDASMERKTSLQDSLRQVNIKNEETLAILRQLDVVLNGPKTADENKRANLDGANSILGVVDKVLDDSIAIRIKVQDVLFALKNDKEPN